PLRIPTAAQSRTRARVSSDSPILMGQVVMSTRGGLAIRLWLWGRPPGRLAAVIRSASRGWPTPAACARKRLLYTTQCYPRTKRAHAPPHGSLADRGRRAVDRICTCLPAPLPRLPQHGALRRRLPASRLSGKNRVGLRASHVSAASLRALRAPLL